MYKITAGDPHEILSIILLENQERFHRAGSLWPQNLAFAAVVIGAIRVTITAGGKTVKILVINKKYFGQ